MAEGIIPNSRRCPKCKTQMVIHSHANKIHGCEWACNGQKKIAKKKPKRCDAVVSVCDSSWFSRSHLKKVEVLEFAYRWWYR
jgi:hypothetical protein